MKLRYLLRKGVTRACITGAVVGLLFWPVVYPADLGKGGFSCKGFRNCGLTIVPRIYYVIAHPKSYSDFGLRPFANFYFQPPVTYCSTASQYACLIEYVAVPLSMLVGAGTGAAVYLLQRYFSKKLSHPSH